MRVLIADDEAPARGRLRRLLADLDGVEVVGEAANGVAALERVAADRPDLLLLDIEMPELDGLGVARALGDAGPAIVFVTAYDAYAVAAFEAAAVDYLLKPVTRARLAEAIERARRAARRPPDLDALLARLAPPRGPARLAVRCGARYVVFDPSRVSAVLAQDHYATLLHEGRELLSEESLDALQRRLDPDAFFRVHRSALVNLAFLRELRRVGDRRYVAILADPAETRVPVSRDRLPDLKRRLGLP